jgi:hypothetical protein
MPFEHDQVIRAQFDRLAAERARVYGEYEAGRLNEDADTTMYAADKITEIDAKIGALNQIVSNFVAGQQRAAPANKYGLNKDELDVAKISGISDEQYARNKSKMESMKQQGYWSQGRVFK